MKHTLFILFLILTLFIGQHIYAQGIGAAAGGVAGKATGNVFKSFGGRVTTTTQIGVTCAAQYGIITIRPVGGFFPPTPYVIPATTKSVSPGGWILGLYNSVLTPGPCYTDDPVPVPVPTFTILKFGASKGLPF